MTEYEKTLRNCLIRTAKTICQWTGDPIPPLWRSVLTDIYETLRDTSVAILENTPYPPEPHESPARLIDVVSQDLKARDTLQAAITDAQVMHDLAQAATDRRRGLGPQDGEAEVQPEPPTVVVGVYGGVVQWVQKTDEKIRVVVRDYDTDGRDAVEYGLQQDAEGHYYAESVE